MENLNWFIVILFGSYAGVLLYSGFRYYIENNFHKFENIKLVKSFTNGEEKADLAKTSQEFKHITEEVVDKIRAMPDIREKGDALEDLVRDVYRMMGYKADTVRELKARGKFPGLTGNDQGADVIVEIIERDQLTNKSFVKERWLIQCKNYKNLDDESGNTAVHKTFGAKSYYLKWYDKIDKGMLITTSPRITIPAIDAATELGIECYDANGLKKLIRKAKANLHQRSMSAYKKK